MVRLHKSELGAIEDHMDMLHRMAKERIGHTVYLCVDLRSKKRNRLYVSQMPKVGSMLLADMRYHQASGVGAFHTPPALYGEVLWKVLGHDYFNGSGEELLRRIGITDSNTLTILMVHGNEG